MILCCSQADWLINRCEVNAVMQSINCLIIFYHQTQVHMLFLLKMRLALICGVALSLLKLNRNNNFIAPSHSGLLKH
jgi:hypothetical protein